jgi:hypothetical protein
MMTGPMGLVRARNIDLGRNGIGAESIAHSAEGRKT